MEYQYVGYDTVDGGRVAQVTLERPEARNAQNRQLLIDLNDAFLRAESDDQVAVVILSGAGPVFSAGHDMVENLEVSRSSNAQFQRWLAAGGRAADVAGVALLLREYVEMAQPSKSDHCPGPRSGVRSRFDARVVLRPHCRRGNVTFGDIVGTRLGMCGVEYFAHPWEFGARKTKELMLTGDTIDVHEAHRLGMVSKVFPADELAARTLEFARRIARLPTVTALLVKESVNQTVDNMGFYNALNACFTLHQLNHSHWAQVTNGDSLIGTAEFGLPADWRSAPAIKPALKDTP